jgi:hypothetical protein
MEADLLDGISDIGVSEHQVLKGLSEASKLSRISNRRLGSGRDLGLRVHGHRDWLAVHHASALKDAESELALSEEESISLMLYEDPPKVVKMVEVLHGEFLLESKYGVLQERYARCDEHNVINIKQQIYSIGTAAEDEQGGVGLGINKTQTEVIGGEPAVPSTRRLFQPVDRLVEVANPTRLRGINKLHRLATVDCL